MKTHDPLRLVWFRQDLRTHDNPALDAACSTGGRVAALYILDEASPGFRRHGGASRWWLHHSLEALSAQLAKLSIPLILRQGSARDVLDAVRSKEPVSHLYWNRRYAPAGIACDTDIKAHLRENGVEVQSFNSALLTEPQKVLTGQGTPYKVFTPFWRAAREASAQNAPLPPPEPVGPARGLEIDSEPLASWKLLPKRPDWSSGLRETWTPGEDGARLRLEQFLDAAIDGYADTRDTPSAGGTSLLSPHLHLGEISPRTVLFAARHRLDASAGPSKDEAKFASELGWREFSHYLMFHFPEIERANFNSKFDRFDWREDAVQLEAWQRGLTGYPIVDAGMRELWATGYMHNRVRMIVASFLTKHLRLHWRHGEAWFWDTLVDADLASNVSNWQWVAGTGADAAPYFRIFNPILQGEKFDAQGLYVRRWVPELAGLPDKLIHKPWTASSSVLETGGVELGNTYPRPLVDHAAGRASALDAFQKLKQG